MIRDSSDTLVNHSGGIELEAGEISIGGDVVGHDKVINNTIYGAVINEGHEPIIKRRAVNPQPPRAPLDFFDRKTEAAQAESLITQGRPIVICGPDGAGKSTLLRQVANSDTARALPDGALLIEGIDAAGSTLSLDDIVQRMFEALFETEPPLKVTEASARTYLSNTRPLVLLDNVQLAAPDQYRTLIDLFPHSAILLARPQALPGLARPIKLGPLPRADAIELFCAISGQVATETTRPALDAICALLDDVPLVIVRTADIVREMNLPLDQAQARLAAAPTTTGDSISIGLGRAVVLMQSVLTPLERQVLDAAANLPGDSIDPQMIVAVSGGAPADGITVAIDHLKALGLLGATGTRVHLDAGLHDVLRNLTVNANAVQDRLLAHLLNDQREGRFADDAYCADELGHILGAIDFAAQQQRWKEAITLGRAIDRFLVLHGLWGAWGQIANRVLQSARAVGDRSNEAWALHQLGTRAIGSDKAQAIDLLKQALSARRAIGETTAAAYTQHNLNVLLPPPPLPPKEGEGAIGATTMSGAVKALLVVAVIGVVAGAAYLLAQVLLAPTLELPHDIRQEATGPNGAVVSFAASARTPVEGLLPISCQPSSGSTFALGQTTVNCEAHSRFGSSVRGSFHIIVQDTTRPQVDVPKDMTLEATSSSGSRADFPASASDLNGRFDVICQPPSGSIFLLDKTTTVTCTATNTRGNSGEASFSITVQDTTPPQLNVPRDSTVEADSASGNTAAYTVAAADDKVDGKVKVVCQPSSGSTFPLGKTTVTCTATDSHNNSGQVTFTISVQDTTPPQLNVSNDLTVEAASANGAIATYSVSAADTVDGKVAVKCEPLSGSTFPLGKTTVTCSAVDSHNNSGRGTFSVTVQDTTPPQIDGHSDMTLEATSPRGSAATYALSAVDTVDGKVAVRCQPVSGSTFPLGKTTVTCTAVDSHNTMAQTRFSITVRDTTKPQITVPKDVIVEATSPAGSKVSYNVSATDLVGPVNVSCDFPSGSTFNRGTTIVKCAATDAAKNIDRGQFRITVQDTKPPTVSQVRSSNDPVYYAVTSCGPTSSAVSATVTDASGLSSVTLRYRYVPTGKSPGPWGTRKMANNPGSDVYRVSIPVRTEANTYLNGANGNIEYQVIAADPAGRTTTRRTFDITVKNNCAIVD